jgi:hypothetical protein
MTKIVKAVFQQQSKKACFTLKAIHVAGLLIKNQFNPKTGITTAILSIAFSGSSRCRSFV